MIDLQDVSLQVGRRLLLRGIEAQLRKGEFVALIGPNGVGKTTLLRAIAGLHAVHAGTILLDGTAGNRLTPRERARRVAFVTGDEILLDALAVRDVVAIGRFPHHRWWQWHAFGSDRRAIARALSAVRMEGFSGRLFATLSAGERQRVWIALGLAQQTPVLLLDEPTSHLDVRVAHEILGLLRALTRAGKTVFCALHDLNEAAAYADRIALLGEGTLLALAPPAQLLTGALIERVYGIAMERVALSGGRLRVFAGAPRDAITDAAPGARRNQEPSA